MSTVRTKETCYTLGYSSPCGPSVPEPHAGSAVADSHDCQSTPAAIAFSAVGRPAGSLKQTAGVGSSRHAGGLPSRLWLSRQRYSCTTLQRVPCHALLWGLLRHDNPRTDWTNAWRCLSTTTWDGAWVGGSTILTATVNSTRGVRLPHALRVARRARRVQQCPTDRRAGEHRMPSRPAPIGARPPMLGKKRSTCCPSRLSAAVRRMTSRAAAAQWLRQMQPQRDQLRNLEVCPSR